MNRSLKLFIALALFLTACTQGIQTGAQSTSTFQDAPIFVAATGESTTISEQIDPNRPALLWFWAPHWVICQFESGEVEQFAQDNPEIQVIGLGSQDNLEFAQEFITQTGLESPTMLWADNFDIWQQFGITVNSQMVLVSGDLTQSSPLFFGFDSTRQQQVIATAENF